MDIRTKEFINKHLNDDIYNLSLIFKNDISIDIDFAIRQILGKNKVKNKIPTFYLNDEIVYPIKLSLEQSSSEITAKYKSNLFKGNKFVDLTGGFGIDCYFISSQFIQCVYVERNSELCECATQNFNVLGSTNIEVYNENSEFYLQKIQEQVDLIYIDPARRDVQGKKVVSLKQCEPDLTEMAPLLLEKAKNVMIKLSPMFDINLALRELPNVNEVHIISIDNECKELILLLSRNKTDKIPLKMVNFLKNDKIQHTETELGIEKIIDCEIAKEVLLYLYEPNSSIMKAGVFKFIAKEFNLKKLHTSTHLYTSDKLFEDFPGRVFVVESIYDFSKDTIKKLKNTIPKANIVVRNFPISVDEFRKKSKISDGGSVYVFACKIANEKNSLIKCSKI